MTITTISTENRQPPWKTFNALQNPDLNAIFTIDDDLFCLNYIIIFTKY